VRYNCNRGFAPSTYPSPCLKAGDAGAFRSRQKLALHGPCPGHLSRPFVQATRSHAGYLGVSGQARPRRDAIARPTLDSDATSTCKPCHDARAQIGAGSPSHRRHLRASTCCCPATRCPDYASDAREEQCGGLARAAKCRFWGNREAAVFISGSYEATHTFGVGGESSTGGLRCGHSWPQLL